MSFLEENLTKGESVVYEARIHWIAFTPFLLFFLFTLLLTFSSGIFSILSLITFVAFVIVVIDTKTTSLAITTKRVVYKTGLLTINSGDIRLSQLESVNIQRGILDRIVGAGGIQFSGSGGTPIVIKSVDDPQTFRKKALEAAEAKEE